MAIDKQTEEFLLDAVENDDFESIKSQLKQDLDINAKFPDGETILHKCFATRKYNLTQHLVLLGVDIFSKNSLNRTPLHIGARSGFYEGTLLYTLLANDLNQQDHKGRIPLMHAIKFKQMLLVKILMSKGSNTDLKDNNGYSSLMWAVKHLDPAELKEMMSQSTDEEIQNHIQECIEQGKDVQVSDEIIDQANEQLAEDGAADKPEQEEIVLPNPLAEMITKPENEEHLAPYSITDHIESLKVKAEQEGFSYEMAIKPEFEKKEYPEDDSSSIRGEETSKDSSVESFSRKTTDEEAISQTVTGDAEPKEEMEIIRGSGANNDQELERQEILSRPESSSPELLEREEVQRVSGKSPEVLESETVKIKRPELDVNSEVMKETERSRSENESDSREINEEQSSLTANNRSTTVADNKETEDESEFMTGKGSVDHIKEETSVIKSLEGEKRQEEQWSGESKGGVDNTTDYEITKLKRAEAKEEAKQSLEEKLDSSTEQETVYVKKKELNYIKDGYKEEYKDDYGEIRSVDKTITQDAPGEIKSVDKQIAETEYGEIKSADKAVESSYEVQEKAPEENLSTNYSRVESTGDPTQEASESIKVTKKEVAPLEREEREKRPELNTDTLQKEEVQRVKSSSPDNVTEESMRVSSTNSENDKENETVKLTSPKELSEEVTEVTGSTENTADEQTIVEGSDTQEQEEVLTVEEQKVMTNMVDANQKNKKGQTLSWLAADKGQATLLKKLIQKGADYEIKDTQGVSPLMTAAMKGHTEVVEYLAHKVRNIDEKRRDGQTALTLAIEADQSDVLKALVDNGASSETKIKGSTLLMHAASMGSVKCIKVLILLGHDPKEKNFRGKTSLDIAKASRQKRAYALLKKIIESRKAG